MLLKDLLKPFPIGTCFLMTRKFHPNRNFTALKISNDRCILHVEVTESTEIIIQSFSDDYIIIDTVQEAIFREDMRKLLE